MEQYYSELPIVIKTNLKLRENIFQIQSRVKHTIGEKILTISRMIKQYKVNMVYNKLKPDDNNFVLTVSSLLMLEINIDVQTVSYIITKYISEFKKRVKYKFDYKHIEKEIVNNLVKNHMCFYPLNEILVIYAKQEINMLRIAESSARL